MTPAEVGDALAGAVRDAGKGVPDVALRCLGPGVYGSPVALRAGVDAGVLGRMVERVPGISRVETERGFLKVFVAEPWELVEDVLAEGERYGAAEVAAAGWADRPRTFDNPGFRVRFAHARMAAVGRRARDLGVRGGPPAGLECREELALLGLLGELPGWARSGVLTGFLERLADGVHDFYERCPALPKGQEKPGAVHAARVTLAAAARIALSNGLTMIGESPRERL
ncbi:DALR anticodon-binding domain-containing protein [Spirillospora sp. NPDC029432]|uniref:DALR anticodon-binding domain-containing protein n=1 Tax=Spirillospora sp. NPDC029432 TaxID=3154599 RepID=UPI003453F808